jgi:hypothetical protein
MFLWEVVKGDEVIPIALETGGRRLLALRPESSAYGITSSLAFLTVRRLCERVELLSHDGLETLWELVKHVQRAVKP